MASATLVDSVSQTKGITFAAVSLVLVSIWRAIWITQKVRFNLGSLDVAAGASEA